MGRPVHIRWMTREDLPRVLAIERESYAHPWEDDAFVGRLCRRNIIGHVAELGENVAGFMIFQLHRTGIELLNLAVAPHLRRQRIGTRLIEALKRKLSPYRRRYLAVALRERTPSAETFLLTCGFGFVGAFPEQIGYQPVKDGSADARAPAVVVAGNWFLYGEPEC